MVPEKQRVSTAAPAAAGLNRFRPLPPIGIFTTRMAKAAPTTGNQ